MSELLRAFVALLRRDLLLAFRRRGELLNPLLFFVLMGTMLTLGIRANPELLQTAGGGMIWVSALLATLLGLEGLFRSDFEDGALEQLALAPQPLPLLVLAKVVVHWLVTGLPLLLVAPLLAAAFGLPGDRIGVLVLTLLLGTPTLSLIGAIGVALTVGLRRGGFLLPLLVLPLYVPVLIFGANAVNMAVAGIDVTGPLYLLAAQLVLALTLAPWASAAALRVSLN